MALTYFVGVYLLFTPGWEEWGNFFAPRAVPLVMVPYALLLFAMGMRYNMASWLLSRGEPQLAIEYASKGLRSHLLRGRREALQNRLMLGRAHIVQGDYTLAAQVLAQGDAARSRGRQALEFVRWRMEAALRLGEMDACHRAGADLDRLKGGPAKNRADCLACRAELAIREGDEDAYRIAMEETLWADADNIRALLTRALAVVEFGSQSQDQGRQAMQWLEVARGPAGVDIPGREAELQALMSLLAWRSEQHDLARRLFDESEGLGADARAQEVVDAVRVLLV